MKTCPVCEYKFKENIKKRRLCTEYADDKKNYLVSCYSCFQSMNLAYKDMWKEYQQSSIGC